MTDEYAFEKRRAISGMVRSARPHLLPAKAISPVSVREAARAAAKRKSLDTAEEVQAHLKTDLRR